MATEAVRPQQPGKQQSDVLMDIRGLKVHFPIRGGLAGRTVISLCRCGHSENKPFCDGSHGRVGFQSSVVAKELPPPKPKL